ncbi:MAG: hypothetical protein Unbinned96contig1001_45 [Prokaryotic dsDNA virus sp.]|nr:MAG: hypothetical protein Unbinned96contig1001_45 [Prokaryotic dsDNA virus sp.]
MPTYTYNCKSCEKDTEVVHKMMEDPIIKCTVCNKVAQKVIRSSNFHLKGSGWFGKSKETKGY